MTKCEVMPSLKNIQAAAFRYSTADDDYRRRIAAGVADDTAAQELNLELASDGLMELAARAWDGRCLATALHAVRSVLEVGLPVSDAIIAGIAGRCTAGAA